MKKESGFRGFSSDSLAFLKNIRAKNSKPWFEKNRDAYERHVLDPFKRLVEDLTPTMLDIDPEFEARPMVNRTISTIYRDTRFSRDKSLFKNNQWLTFKRRSPEWKDAPAYYFEINPTFYRYGMGYYNASRFSMDKFRECLDDDPEPFRRAVSFFKRKDSPFELAGEAYKRPLPCVHPPEFCRWVQMKSFYLVCNRGIDRTLFSSELTGVLSAGFRMMGPLYRYLTAIR
jgi:uncharacterized protein (TIGR02453 family)